MYYHNTQQLVTQKLNELSQTTHNTVAINAKLHMIIHSRSDRLTQNGVDYGSVVRSRIRGSVPVDPCRRTYSEIALRIMNSANEY